MRLFIFIFLFIPYVAFANLEQYKTLCKEIGYKPGTENFGSCVLKLKKKNDTQKNLETQQQIVNQQQNQYQQNTNVAATREQAIRDAEAYFSQIQQQNQILEKQYQVQLAAYNQQKKQIEAEEARRKKQRALKQIEMGLRMASGQSVTDAAIDTAGLRPLQPPSRPSFYPMERYQVTLPNGSFYTCNYDPNTRRANCF